MVSRIVRPHRRLPQEEDLMPEVPGPDGPSQGSPFIPAPEGMFVCPNGHENQIAVNIQNMGEKVDGMYCMVCWTQFVTQHTPRVRLVRFED